MRLAEQMQSSGAPTEQGLHRFGRSNCCCEHTHVCCRMCHFRTAPKESKCFNGVRPNQVLPQAYIRCAADDKMIKLKISPRGSTVTTVLTDQKAAVSAHTHCKLRAHTCVLQHNTQRQELHPRVKVYEGLADLRVLLSTQTHTHAHACCRTDEFRNSGLHRRDQTLHKVWPTDCCSEHTTAVLLTMATQALHAHVL